MLIILVILAVAANLVDSIALNISIGEINRLATSDCALRHALLHLQLAQHVPRGQLVDIPARCRRH